MDYMSLTWLILLATPEVKLWHCIQAPFMATPQTTNVSQNFGMRMLTLLSRWEAFMESLISMSITIGNSMLTMKITSSELASFLMFCLMRKISAIIPKKRSMLWGIIVK